jgi:Co/Zn/Cd efflux system component
MPDREERVRFAAFLNVAFTVLELVGGFWTNSLAILSDALHDFGAIVTLNNVQKLAKNVRSSIQLPMIMFYDFAEW